MMVTALQIHCDGEGCKSMYPPTGGADGAIFTPADVRQMAKKVGWKRDRVEQKDFCFDCARGVPTARKGKAA